MVAMTGDFDAGIRWLFRSIDSYLATIRARMETSHLTGWLPGPEPLGLSIDRKSDPTRAPAGASRPPGLAPGLMPALLAVAEVGQARRLEPDVLERDRAAIARR
jgi:hypothetical protein